MDSLLPELSQAISGAVDVGSNGVVQVDGRSRIPARLVKKPAETRQISPKR